MPFIFQIWGSKDITDIRQLKGKLIAVGPPRDALDIASREALKRLGLAPDRDIKFIYNDRGLPAILTAVASHTVSAGTLSSPLTLKAQDAGLNLLLDMAPLRIPGLLQAYGTTEKFLRDYPNTVRAFLKAMAEGVVLAKKDPVVATKAIGRFLKIQDRQLLDAAHRDFPPYWEKSLSVPDNVIRAELNYLDPKQFPQAQNANPKEFFDNRFADELKETGFLRKIRLSE